MLSYYCWNTQNARKAAIFFEEANLPYRIVPINLLEDENKAAPFLAVNPNGRIPALVDTGDGGRDAETVTVFESGCILQYLAEKTGLYLPTHPAQRYQVLSWLYWQMSGLGPTLGQFAHFAAVLAMDSPRVNSLLKRHCAKEVHPYAIERFRNESLRLLGVLDGQLRSRDYVCGDYSVADMAAFPWVESVWTGFRAVDGEIDHRLANVARWLARMMVRTSVNTVLEKYAWEVDFPEVAEAHNTKVG